MIQDTVLIVTIALMALITLVFLKVAFGASKKVPNYTPIEKKSSAARVRFFWGLLVATVIITVLTLLDLPYAANRGDIPADAVQVNVQGRQWHWVMDKNQAQAGQTVVFNVTAADVTHGLGVYNPQMKLIGQTQAMPFGYLNKLKIHFDEPGEYQLLCMEYCGIAHHNMISPFTIVSTQGGQ